VREQQVETCAFLLQHGADPNSMETQRDRVGGKLMLVMLYLFTILAPCLRYLAGYPVRRQDLMHVVRTKKPYLPKSPLVFFEKHVFFIDFSTGL
jgi:hypothetical protein